MGDLVKINFTGQRFTGKNKSKSIEFRKVELSVSVDIVGKLKELIDKFCSLFFCKLRIYFGE